MTLLELCEPLFQYVCRLSRSARRGCDLSMDQVSNDLKRILREMSAGASASPALADQYEQVELPLIFFVDFMIKEGNLSFAAEWRELARERKELAGDEKFFDLLDETLADPSDTATQRLMVFYTCLGLGFTGIYAGQPESIRKLMSRIAGRISGQIDADPRSAICPEAYENVDTRDFVAPPTTKLVGIGIVLVGLLVTWVFVYFFLFKNAGHDVKVWVENVQEAYSSSR